MPLAIDAAALGPADRQFPVTPLERFLLDCETRFTPMVIRVILRFRGHGDALLLERAITAAD